jgi:ABC-type multidrug transport system fused ATPase/permease subunit
MLKWVVRDGWRHFRAAFVGVLALNLIGTALGAATVAGIVLYARYLESGQPVGITGWELQPPQTVAGIIALATVMCVLGLISAAALYSMQWLSGRIVISYWRLCMRRLLRICADPAYAGWASLVPGRPQAAVWNLAGHSARITAVILRRLLLITLPVIVFMIATTCLIAVSPVLTGLLVPLMLAYLVLLHRITRAVVRQQADYLRASRGARAELRESIELANAHDGAEAGAETSEVERSLESPQRIRAEELYARRRLADDRVHLLNTVFFVVCVFVLFAFFSIQVGTSDHTWSELLLYVVALRFAVTELRRVTRMMVLMGRFVPLAARFRQFVEGAEALRRARAQSRESTPVLPDEITIECGAHLLWESSECVRMPRGSVLWVLLPWPPGRADLEAIPLRLQHAAREPLTLQGEAVHVVNDHWPVEIEAHSSMNRVRHSHDQVATKERRAATASAETGPSSRRLVIVASGHDLRGIGARSIERMIGGYDQTFVILAARDPRVPLSSTFAGLADRTAGIVVMKDGEIVAGGNLEWLSDHLGPIRAALRRRTDDEVDDIVDDDDEDDADDDDDLS